MFSRPFVYLKISISNSLFFLLFLNYSLQASLFLFSICKSAFLTQILPYGRPNRIS